ncbi:hypothetical protein [Deinococcus gobiensis]|uniref:Uncharacterized protein n=1 Tax=Deinococcus gobiensis (strain DSM 21396 / JCM 16679 / CGMCC 1.7299 / I-0) TaxID=745776 RepID=H8H1Z3_DEIGI|nr:hypothetical protein [Deinococcus gobiensis]AFD27540.1 hypothetical protein DGo_PB0271 [Deinococcus gobiensis I-0]
MDADAVAAWSAHEALLERLVEDGRLTPEVAADLRSPQGKEAWLRAYGLERGRLWWSATGGG